MPARKRTRTPLRKRPAAKAAPTPRLSPIIEPLVLRQREAMTALQVSERELRNLIYSGKLVCSRVGRMRLVHVSSIKKLLADTATPAQ